MDTAASSSLATVESTNAEFAGKWHRLVSLTNWEKGRLISEWRAALIEGDAPATSYSDEAWSRTVGGVSGQHVGRLRRVWERFQGTRDSYPGLFWSHFAASLEWDDAELWLEGAVQGEWSVARMREQRWEALGAPDDKKPRSEDVLSSEWDPEAGQGTDILASPRVTGEPSRLYDPAEQGREAIDEDDADLERAEHDDAPPWDDEPAAADRDDAERPFAELAELPDDLAEAVDQFKLAVVRYREEGWQTVSRATCLAALDALRRFVELEG